MLKDYWREAVSQSLDNNGISAPDSIIEAIARDMESARENESLALGYVENPLIAQMSNLQDKRKIEIANIKDSNEQMLKDIRENYEFAIRHLKNRISELEQEIERVKNA